MLFDWKLLIIEIWKAQTLLRSYRICPTRGTISFKTCVSVYTFQVQAIFYLQLSSNFSEQVGSRQVGSMQVGRQAVGRQQVDCRYIAGRQQVCSRQVISRYVAGRQVVGMQQVGKQKVCSRQVVGIVILLYLLHLELCHFDLLPVRSNDNFF